MLAAFDNVHHTAEMRTCDTGTLKVKNHENNVYQQRAHCHEHFEREVTEWNCTKTEKLILRVLQVGIGHSKRSVLPHLCTMTSYSVLALGMTAGTFDLAL